MTIARQAAMKRARKREPKLIDVTDKKVYKAEGTQKHFNFRPKGKDNRNGGLYVD